jgi:pheromone shutdown-related protein TraB
MADFVEKAQEHTKTFFAQGREFILVGTAHISKESVDEVKRAIVERCPDCVAVELDEQRLTAVKTPDSWKNLDIIQVLKKKQGFVLMANLMLSSFQKRMGLDVGVKPGEEMKAAVEQAEALGIKTAMVDRPIQITLRRAWAKNSLFGKAKLFAALIMGAFSNEKISAEQVENLKNSNEMDSMMEELASEMPAVKTVLIDERDKYLASGIWRSEGNKVLAVLGAGHIPGVMRHLAMLNGGEESPDTSALEAVPPPGALSRAAGFVFPAAIVALIIAGFFTGGFDSSVAMLVRWLLWNGSLAALGTLVAGGHILAVLTGFVAAPVGTLNPFLAVGFFTGLVQAAIKKPKVEDLQTLTDDIASVKGVYKNRALRVLLVFVLSSLGGAAGNIIAVPALVSSVLK